MVFVNKLASSGFAEAGKQLTNQRRAAAKAGDQEAYKQAVYQLKGMEMKFHNATMKQVFTGMKVTEDQFKMTMSSYMQDASTGPHL